MREMLDAGFELFRATLAQCIPYGVLLVIAGQLGNFHELATGRVPHAGGGHDAAWWLWYGIGLVICLLLWGALLLRQDALAKGTAGSVRAELRTALGRLPQLVALTLLCAASVGVGLLVLVVPGVYLAVACAFAAPVLLLERRGTVDALAGAARLVRGRWWRTALMLCTVVLMTLAFYAMLGTIIAAAASVSIADAANRGLIAAVSAIAGVVVGSISAPFGSAMVLTLYGDLCRLEHH